VRLRERAVPLTRALALAAALAAAAAPGRSGAQPAPVPVPAARASADAARPAPAARPLDGTSHDYDYPPGGAAPAAGDSAASSAGAVPPERGWLGRVFVHRLAAANPKKPLPILVFLHGTNADKIKYRWMGGGQEGDLRRIAAELMEAGQIPPMLVAAPSTILPAATAIARTSWPAFDLDTFLDITAAKLRGIATIDRNQVIVAGHSGGGCNREGGLVTAVRGSTPVHAALVIDSCMDLDVATPLAHTRPTTHVIVSFQLMSWTRRPIADFKRAFQRAVERAPAAPGVLRTLEQLHPTEPMPHDAIVPLVLRRWLPSLLSPDAAPTVPCVSP
jgi:hypothetical protein